jgi:hypothetical protein
MENVEKIEEVVDVTVENRRKLIKEFRVYYDMNLGGVGRETLLAYAFLRGVPYVALEKVINEDKFPEVPITGTYSNRRAKVGKFSFLDSLAYSTAYRIESVEKRLDPKSAYKYHNDVWNWMMVKYDAMETSKIVEVAA